MAFWGFQGNTRGAHTYYYDYTTLTLYRSNLT
jgi:hypothetical protein